MHEIPHIDERERMLVIGMGAFAFGRERRAVRTLRQMAPVDPYFLISKWEDGNVSALVERSGFAYGKAPFGYLGRARPGWTLVTLLHLPILLVTVLAAYRRKQCRTILVLELNAFLNALPAILWLRFVRGGRIVFYLGDTPLDRPVSRLIGRLVDRLADAVVVNAHSVRRGLEAIGIRSAPIAVVYNGVDLSHFHPRGESAHLKELTGWEADDVLVGFVGQFTENKGIGDVLDAAEIVARTDLRCRFVLVGDVNELDPFQMRLEARIREAGLDDRVLITGWMEDVAPIYRDLDVLVVPSRHDDPAPNTNIEAMASGVPVVATPVGGTPELVGDAAFLVERASPEQLARRILELAADPEKRRAMGAAGRARAEGLFDAASNARVVEQHLLGPGEPLLDLDHVRLAAEG